MPYNMDMQLKNIKYMFFAYIINSRAMDLKLTNDEMNLIQKMPLFLLK